MKKTNVDSIVIGWLGILKKYKLLVKKLNKLQIMNLNNGRVAIFIVSILNFI